MSTVETTVATVPKSSALLLPRLAEQAGLDPAKFYATIKATCGCQGASEEHFATLLMVADRYKLNPSLRQLFLIPTKKGIEVVIPIDGWVPLLVNHPDYLAHEVVLHWEGVPFASKCLAATCRIWTKRRQAIGLGPFEHSETMLECFRDSGPWKSHTVRMLGHKAVIQATRRCFGIYIMDEDEARNIGEPIPERGYTLPTDPQPEPRTVEYVVPSERELRSVEYVLPTACPETKTDMPDQTMFERFSHRIGAANSIEALSEIDGDMHMQSDFGKIAKSDLDTLQLALVERMKAIGALSPA